ncbi:MAG: hypothetical protein ACJ79L_01255 [Anaeromyxobacteraceae bacterium]
MLYYGDRAREVAPGLALEAVREALRAAWREEGLARHARLVEALVTAGELAQALADAALRARGGLDDDDPAAAAAMAVTGAAARAVWASWRSRFRSAALPAPAEVERLSGDVERRCDPARALRVTVPEGYAHYALYPETYGEAAAEAFGADDRPPVVVGIRSIGTGLAALVAAAAGASEVATVRPVGHPWERSLALGGALAARLAAAARGGVPLAVVDEGPGLSGSSFASVARWLERAGAAPGSIHFFPAHGAPLGHAAAPEVRARWERSARHLAPFETAVAPRLAGWASELAGPLGALTDVSAGAWRRHAHTDPARWPPVFAQAERRKYLARAAAGAVLLRFAGLGSYGAAALRRARALAGAGFAPPALGLAHGFVVERWVEGEPLDAPRAPREALVRHLARYLAFRARTFPAGGGDGASPERLLELIAVNAREALGPEAEAAARALEPGARLAATLARCDVDAKLEAWEWLVVDGGVLVKTDAVDHAHGHDLVGPQPIAWDVAGAAVELGLDATARDDLAARVALEAGCAVPPEALAFLEAAYLAQRVGRWSFALACEGDPAERERIAALLARYRTRLARALGQRA